MRHDESGAALLEAIVALALLGWAAVALAGLVQQNLITVRQVQDTERRIMKANAFLEAVALWSKTDLDRRLGNRSNGPWRLHIDHLPGGLYDVAARDSATGSVLVATTLYRRADGTTP